MAYASKKKIKWADSWVCRPSRFRLLTLFLYFCIFFFPGYSLKCNYCVSFESWNECNDTMKQVTCLSSQNRCAKANIKAETAAASAEIFLKGCTTSSDCSAHNCKSIYPSVKITKCEIYCCTGDLCNGAQVPMVSVIMLLACAILAFSR